MPTFFRDEDYRAYLTLMAEWCRRCGVEVWAYCLMPNHVHLIAVPDSEDALRRGIGEAHRRYSRMINFREDWRGHLWQGRFASFPLDQTYLLAAARYIEQNPVRAGLVPDPQSWHWSSARAHLAGTDDELVRVEPLLEMVGDWRLFLSEMATEEQLDDIRRHERTGRPLGPEHFLDHLESLLDRTLKPEKPGPKGKRY
jgi:putative transposase